MVEISGTPDSVANKKSTSVSFQIAKLGLLVTFFCQMIYIMFFGGSAIVSFLSIPNPTDWDLMNTGYAGLFIALSLIPFITMADIRKKETPLELAISWSVLSILAGFATIVSIIEGRQFYTENLFMFLLPGVIALFFVLVIVYEKRKYAIEHEWW